MADEVKKENEIKEEAVATSEEKTEAPKGKDAPAEVSAKAGEDVEVPKKFKDLVNQVESMSVIELHELVKLLEKKFGVSAAAVAVASGAGAGGDSGEEEKSEFKVELKAVGAQKIAVIKAIKELLGLGLKEAKDLVDGAPSVLKENAKKEEANAMKAKIAEAGGTVELS